MARPAAGHPVTGGADMGMPPPAGDPELASLLATHPPETEKSLIILVVRSLGTLLAACRVGDDPNL